MDVNILTKRVIAHESQREDKKECCILNNKKMAAEKFEKKMEGEKKKIRKKATVILKYYSTLKTLQFYSIRLKIRFNVLQRHDNQLQY